MATVVCKAKKNGVVKRRLPVEDGTDEKGRIRYKCWGWFDKMTDEPIDECRACPDWVENE